MVFSALRGVSDALEPHTVEFGDLDPQSDNVFFGDLLVREIAEDETADVYVFVGPESQFGQKIPPDSIETLGAVTAPVYYLNSERGANWSGLVKNSVKTLGGKELRVQSPEDLWKAMRKMLPAM